MKNKAVSQICFYLSLLAVILAVIGSFGTDIWLASTQWVLVAAVLGVWAIYLRA